MNSLTGAPRAEKMTDSVPPPPPALTREVTSAPIPIPAYGSTITLPTPEPSPVPDDPYHARPQPVKRPRKVSAWTTHINSYRKANPSLSFKEALQGAKLTYTRN